MHLFIRSQIAFGSLVDSNLMLGTRVKVSTTFYSHWLHWKLLFTSVSCLASSRAAGGGRQSEN